MKIHAKLLLPLVLGIMVSMLLIVGPTLAQEKKMSMEEYRAQLAEWQKREADAKAAIITTEAEIEALKAEIAKVDAEIALVWQEIYALLGTDEAGVNAFRSDLTSLEGEVDALAALSPEELYKRKKDIDQLEKRLAEFKKSKIALLSEMQDKIATIEGKITRLRASLPAAVYDEYTVVKGDYLWKISGKKDIYADPYQWIRIYTYNRYQIKDPDLIYPAQIFKIQREVGPNEYLVVKGDWLAKIAAKPDIFNSPTKWTELYEANKVVIGDDPGRIYPYQVLIVPGK
ncbi:MAG: LysM peptidoglycan-binding domain-containing protein [candidate division KSB1 bacterium]|nr:LysM peptidoglycan-binding domain-containing protein [candidate division KSB1 bacterium]